MSIKEIAMDFLKLTSKGQSRQAFNQYIAAQFKHHNIHFKGDGETLMIAMEENSRLYPDMVFEIKRALEDGNLVAVHSRARLSPKDQDMAIIHIFQFEENKIVELWDFGQPVPTEIANENGMF